MNKCLVIVYKLEENSFFNPMVQAMKDASINFLIGSSSVESKWLDNSLISTSRYILSPKLNKLFSIVFRRFLKLKVWEVTFYYSHIKKIKEFNPDFVISLVSRDTEASMNLANRIANKIRKPHIIHMVDPIPPPKHWENYELYRKSLIHGVKIALKNSLVVSMGNQNMIEHQQSYLNFDILNKSFIFPDPIQSARITLKKPSNKFSFAYVGSFYGARSPKGLLLAFQKFSYKYDNAQLWLVGSFNFDINSFGLSKETISKIKFIKWTENVIEIYEKVNILIDVDADYIGDVFMSSKIKKYLAVNRLILSITSQNSPTYRLVKKIPKTASVSSHNVDSIVCEMENLVNKNIITEDYLERDSIIEEMNVDRNMDKLINFIKSKVN